MQVGGERERPSRAFAHMAAKSAAPAWSSSRPTISVRKATAAKAGTRCTRRAALVEVDDEDSGGGADTIVVLRCDCDLILINYYLNNYGTIYRII